MTTARPRPTPSVAASEDPAPPWHSLHLALHTGGAQTDAFVTDDLAPLMDEVTADPRTAWFYIRYKADMAALGGGTPHTP